MRRYLTLLLALGSCFFLLHETAARASSNASSRAAIVQPHVEVVGPFAQITSPRCPVFSHPRSETAAGHPERAQSRLISFGSYFGASAAFDIQLRTRATIKRACLRIISFSRLPDRAAPVVLIDGVAFLPRKRPHKITGITGRRPLRFIESRYDVTDWRSPQRHIRTVDALVFGRIHHIRIGIEPGFGPIQGSVALELDIKDLPTVRKFDLSDMPTRERQEAPGILVWPCRNESAPHTPDDGRRPAVGAK